FEIITAVYIRQFATEAQPAFVIILLIISLNTIDIDIGGGQHIVCNVAKRITCRIVIIVGLQLVTLDAISAIVGIHIQLMPAGICITVVKIGIDIVSCTAGGIACLQHP